MTGPRALFATAAGVALAVLAGWLALGRLESGSVGPASRRSVEAQTGGTPVPPGQVSDPLAEFAVIELAGPEDVLIEAVLGDAPAGGFAADSPVCDPMTLAGPDDVTLVRVRPGPRGAHPACGLCPRRGDAPMIYATGPRTR